MTIVIMLLFALFVLGVAAFSIFILALCKVAAMIAPEPPNNSIK